MTEKSTKAHIISDNTNIYLIGYRCTGKTTLGKALADRLERRFVDTDDWIVAREGMSIAELVKQHGWPYFREKERAVIKEVSSGKAMVVATGGGAVTNSENVTNMKAGGTVVWLKARPATIIKWMRKDPRSGDFRPALTENDPEHEIHETLTQREPLYAAAMNFSVNTDDFNIQCLCDQIIHQIAQIRK